MYVHHGPEIEKNASTFVKKFNQYLIMKFSKMMEMLENKRRIL
jgi:hypothetical protein